MLDTDSFPLARRQAHDDGDLKAKRASDARRWLLIARRLAFILVTGVLFLLAAAGSAMTGGTRIAALSLADIPEAASIEVQLPTEGQSEDLGLSIKLANHLAILLAERGYRPVDGFGELVLRFAAEEPTYASREDQPNGSLQKVSFDTKERLAQSDPDLLRLRISVARTKQPPIWTGVIEHFARGRDKDRPIWIWSKRSWRIGGKPMTDVSRQERECWSRQCVREPS